MKLAQKIAVLAMLFPSMAFAYEVPRQCEAGPGAAIGGVTTVYFDTGSTKIKGEGKHWLEVKAEQLEGNPNIWICIIGQADKQGSKEANAILSQKRAQVVADYLQSLGLPADLMKLGWRDEAWGDSTLGGILGTAEDEGTEDDRRVDVFAVRYRS